ncbi:zeta toxin family protein [Patescibacteria group bacterium]|nr:zeta toxin family protein [Patescibacteria group bacterium]MCL5114794.1 zeta toxin family protein [Patescibacteria group bacterium]
MAYVFITGIPAAGKSFIAEKIAKEHGIMHVDVDSFRVEMEKDPKLELWVNYFWNKDEAKYFEKSCEERWKDIVDQSEAFWPFFSNRMREIMQSNSSAIFEGVNLLPHIVSRDFQFPGVVLLGESFETIFGRNKQDPRWGKTEDLQKKEAESFFFCEGEQYKKEGEQYGWKAFSDPSEAERKLLKIMGL